jgi:proteasome accessory factor A
VIHDKAGERVLERSLEEVHRTMPGGQRLAVYKNNSDGKGNSYGTHENYLVDRQVPFGSLVTGLTPFFVTRQVFTGLEARRGAWTTGPRTLPPTARRLRGQWG